MVQFGQSKCQMTIQALDF